MNYVTLKKLSLITTDVSVDDNLPQIWRCQSVLKKAFNDWYRLLYHFPGILLICVRSCRAFLNRTSLGPGSRDFSIDLECTWRGKNSKKRLNCKCAMLEKVQWKTKVLQNTKPPLNLNECSFRNHVAPHASGIYWSRFSIVLFSWVFIPLKP